VLIELVLVAVALGGMVLATSSMLLRAAMIRSS
jgi:hypothetical protein